MLSLASPSSPSSPKKNSIEISTKGEKSAENLSGNNSISLNKSVDSKRTCLNADKMHETGSFDIGTESHKQANFPPGSIIKDGRHAWRVRIYELNNESSWDDAGTGFCEVLYLEDKACACIVVKSEDTDSSLLESNIVKDDIYHIQQETLILWTEPNGRDLALSFQDREGCADIIESINEVRKRLADIDLAKRLQQDEGFFQKSEEDENELESQLQMPPIESSNLEQIEIIAEEMLRTSLGREKLIRLCVKDSLIEKICNLFDVAEKNSSKQPIIHMFGIMRAIIATNDLSIFEIVLREDLILKVCGIFEYDPEYPTPLGTHRDFLSNKNRFIKVVDLKNPSLEAKIHQTFRAQYLKDVVFARIVEDAHFSVLSSIIMFNQAEILSNIGSNQDILEQLSFMLKSNGGNESERVLALKFVQDFCNISKNVQMVKRQNFFRQLATHGVLQELPPFLSHQERELRTIVADIIVNIIENDPTLIRSFVLAQKEHSRKPLTETVIERLIEESDEGIKYQYVDILKMLMELPQSEPTELTDCADFFHYFFVDHIMLLLQPLKKLYVSDMNQKDISNVLNPTYEQIALYTYIIELICYFIHAHTQRIKLPLLRQELNIKIGYLLESRSNCLKAVGVRYFRTLVGQKDEFYNRFIIKHNILSPVFRAFELNGKKYNMFNSVCLDLIDFIAKDKNKKMIKYVVETFGEILKSIDYVETGAELFKAYDTLFESANETNQPISIETEAKMRVKEEKELEEYFEEEDDDEEDEVKTLPDETSETGSESMPELPEIVHKNNESDEEEDMFLKRLNMQRGSPKIGRVRNMGKKKAGTIRIRSSSLKESKIQSKKPVNCVEEADNADKSVNTIRHREKPAEVTSSPIADEEKHMALSLPTSPPLSSPIAGPSITPPRVRNLTSTAKNLLINEGKVSSSPSSDSPSTKTLESKQNPQEIVQGQKK